MKIKIKNKRQRALSFLQLLWMCCGILSFGGLMLMVGDEQYLIPDKLKLSDFTLITGILFISPMVILYGIPMMINDFKSWKARHYKDGVLEI